MQKHGMYHEVQKQIEIMPYNELIRLMGRILTRLNSNSKPRPRHNLLNLYGAGKGLWKEDAQKYVSGLREDR